MGAQVERGLLARLVKQAEQAIDRVEAAHPDLGGDVTEFELATAVGFLCFRHAAVDIVILETGLGGRLDATNVVLPELTVITTIGHDHTNRLGESLVQIARERAVSSNAGVPVVSGVKRGGAKMYCALLPRRKMRLGTPPEKFLGTSSAGI